MRIDHVAIWVRNLEAMRTFYQTYFGATANDRYHNSRTDLLTYFLTFGGAAGEPGCRLELMQRADIPESLTDPIGQATGLTHLALQLGSETAVDGLTERLRADGYRVVGEPRRTGDGYYESVVLDPEQNRIELIA
ncbi:VOC family protein [Spirosoma luteolum]